MINSKLIGGILLIVGTSIGGGMLALPVATAALGPGHSILFLILCWMIMTAGAFLLLETNLRYPPGSNMISMAKATFGLPGQITVWVFYLLLLYSLLAAYISGGSDVFNGLLQQVNVQVPSWSTSIVFTALFSFIIYSGIRAVDYVNRGLMFGKLGIYLLLIFTISPHVHLPPFHNGQVSAIKDCLMILITSFGFASIIPSLRDYFRDDIVSLRRVIWWGSLIPLVCYILWNLVIMGVLQQDGGQSVLIALSHSDHATSGLNEALAQVIHNPWINGFFNFFTSICMITAFLGVSLGLFDFLADGLNLKKHGHQGKATLIFTFLPPLAVVLFYPGIYLNALAYAGVCCVFLLLLTPTLMAWKERQGAVKTREWVVPGGKLVLVVTFCTSIILLWIAAN